MRAHVFLAGVALLAAGCEEDEIPTVEPGGVMLVLPLKGDPVLGWMLPDITGDLKTLAGSDPQVERLDPGSSAAVLEAAEAGRAGLVLVVDAQELASDVVPESALSALGADGFRLVTRDEGSWANRLGSRGATVVYIGAAAVLAKQYAIYEVLRRLGARFYHPEQEYLPQNDPTVLRDRAKQPTVIARKGSEDYVPDFAQRSYTFHGAHPLEHLEAFSDGDHPIDEAVNVNRWIVKNRGNLFRGAGRGVASATARAKRVQELEQLRLKMGFPRGAGITLHNQQQGANAVVDPSKPTPPKQQIEDYVAERLQEVPDATSFGIHFGPTEFTVTPDEQTVDWIDWAGQKALALKSDLRVLVNDHITGTQPTDNYGDLGCPPGTNSQNTCDYYDLAFHTDSRFGVSVHTVMFYPLEGPARVYNQQSFAHKLCLMKQASAKGRPLVYFPEGAWWLSFDNPIPVYLPLYIWARGRDIELVVPLLESRGGGTVEGHRMFNSGHAWGYWQQDYAVGLWHWNADVTLDQVLGEILDPLCGPEDWEQGCAARTEAIAVLNEVIKHQRTNLLTRKDWRNLPGGLYAYLAGEDPADEIAAVAGFEFRPVKVSFTTVAGWSDKQLQLFRGTDLLALEQMRDAYDGWLARLSTLQAQVPAAGKPWLDEIVDGIEINKLRAQQAYQLYDAVLTFREAVLAGESDPKAKAWPLWQTAETTLKAAQAVIKRREAAYRYPAAQMYGGGVTPETAVDNGTTYPYRVHTKTHLLTYWHNRQQDARNVLEGKSSNNALDLSPVLADPGAVLKVSWPTASDLTADVTIGSTQVTTADTEVDLGADEGYFPVSGKLVVGGNEIPLAGGVARAATRARTPPKGFTLVEPASSVAQGVLNSLFPAIQWAVIDGAAPSAVVFAPDLNDDGAPSFMHVVHCSVAQLTGGKFTTAPVSTQLPIPNPGGGGAAVSIGLVDLVLEGTVSSGALASPVVLQGEIVLDDLVQILIDLAGFDSKGALQLLASVLSFDPDNPPKTVPVKGDLTIE
jgi:hypothetical protein